MGALVAIDYDATVQRTRMESPRFFGYAKSREVSAALLLLLLPFFWPRAVVTTIRESFRYQWLHREIIAPNHSTQNRMKSTPPKEDGKKKKMKKKEEEDRVVVRRTRTWCIVYMKKKKRRTETNDTI